MGRDLNDSDKIDFLKYLKIIWLKRALVLKTSAFFMVLGVIIALVTPIEYSSSITVVPDTGGDSELGELSGLAAIAGINISEGNYEVITPSLYPRIFNSIPFQKDILNLEVNIEALEKPVSLQVYYSKYLETNFLGVVYNYTILLPQKLMKLMRPRVESFNQRGGLKNEDNIIVLNDEELEALNWIRKAVAIDVNEKEGYVKISTKMPEAQATAQLASQVQELLQKYITDFKIKKITSKLKFIEERYLEKKQEFEKVQEELALFTDKNLNLTSATAQANLQRLQAKYSLTFNIFQEISKQYENTKIQVEEDMPEFAVIEPALIPFERAKPKRVKTVFTFMVVGFMISCALVVLEEPWRTLVRRWSSI